MFRLLFSTQQIDVYQKSYESFCMRNKPKLNFGLCHRSHILFHEIREPVKLTVKLEYVQPQKTEGLIMTSPHL